MSVFERTSELPVSASEAFHWHARPGALDRLIPPWQRVSVLEARPGEDGSPIGQGARVTLGLRLMPGVTLRWLAEHERPTPLADEGDATGVAGGSEGNGAAGQFVDVQVRGPFARWRHEHRFEPVDADRCRLVDRIDYAVRGGALGRWLGGGHVRRTLERVFRYRHRVTAEDLAMHGRLSARVGVGPQRVAISGSSGLVGSRLAAVLGTGGHTVVPLVRRASQAGSGGDGRDAPVLCDPLGGRIDAEALARAEPTAVVHLAGEPVVGRWTARKKRAIRESRVEGTRGLCEALAAMTHRPDVLVCASAVGIYGDRGDAVLTEDAEPGEGFLAEVCRGWESACEPARAAGIRVVHLRIGLVISGRGGALAKMVTPFAAGLGGRLGSGRQWWPWIAIDDLVGMMMQAIADERWRGPVNAVGPEPLRNAEVTAALGRVLGRPAVLPVPRAAIGLAMGEMGRVLLDSQRCSADRAVSLGYRFRFDRLEAALRHELGR